MSRPHPTPIQLKEGRFARFDAIEWWDQSRLKTARVLVVGAGALGNEILKNLALLGLGNVVIVDMDIIEKSNLSRSILFRESDEGISKAERAAHMMKEICPDVNPTPLMGNILSDVGLGYFRWADVVVGALDNREARVYVNSVCSMLHRPWIDGGIEVLQGIVRGFAPPDTACYECTMSKADWDLINQRRSCSLLARRAMAQRGTPTTPTTASVIGGIQAQEVVKMLHGLETLRGKGWFFDGLSHDSYRVEYQVNPDCGCHEPPSPVHSFKDVTSDAPLRILAERASRLLDGLDAVDLGREQIRDLTCPSCGRVEEVWRSEEKISEDQAVCGHCGHESVPAFFHSLEAGSALLERTPRQLGLPPWDIVWARRDASMVGLEISGDNPFNTGPAIGSDKEKVIYSEL
ncbi:MAG: ThiF family adenylyltransferase [Desulfobacterales bacterium]|nr:ThiF family adenylyltransferase [Desulfobacterales bacterium]